VKIVRKFPEAEWSGFQSQPEICNFVQISGHGNQNDHHLDALLGTMFSFGMVKK
jgi:hypothetical protein